jgi:hypothetical protein
MPEFLSSITELSPLSLSLPPFRGVRIQLMPILMNQSDSLPDNLAYWSSTLDELFKLSPDNTNGVAYLTIDERFVLKGYNHRRPGLHVDGMGAWGEERVERVERDRKGGAWSSNGMLTISNVEGCAAYNQIFIGSPKSGSDPGDPSEGDCEHLRDQCLDNHRIILKPNIVYHCSPLCVHESLPMYSECYRSFVRLSMPSSSPWPANCTINPKVKPGGPIGPPRRVEGAYSY